MRRVAVSLVILLLIGVVFAAGVVIENRDLTIINGDLNVSGGNAYISGDVSATNINASGTVYANTGDFLTSIIAPILYDKDNTGYYVNPASSTKLNTLFIMSTLNCSKLYTDATGQVLCGVDQGFTSLTGTAPISVTTAGTAATISLDYNTTYFTLDASNNLALTTAYATGSAYDSRFVNEGQANSITSSMIVDGTITTADIANGAITSAKIADGTIQIADINTTQFDARYVNEGQSAGGDLSGTYPNPTVTGLLGRALPTLSTGALYWNGSSWVFQTVDTNPNDDITGSGTAGYIPYFSNTQTLSSSGLYWDSANSRLGIGTTSPAYTLDVVGNIRASGSNGAYVITRIYPANDTTAALGGFEIRVRDTGGLEKYWRIYSAPIGGGFGVTPLGLEIWEYNYPGCGSGGICQPRFRILPGGGGRLDIGTTQLEYTGSGGVKVSKLVDRDNTSYYVDPSSLSKLSRLAISSVVNCSGKLITDATGEVVCGTDAGITTITGTNPISVSTSPDGTTASISLKYDTTYFTTDVDGNLELSTPYATGSAYDARFINEGQSAGGDLSGTYPNPTVVAIQGYPVSATAPSSGQALVWNGTQYVPTTVDTSTTNELQNVFSNVSDGINTATADTTTDTLTIQGGAGISVTVDATTDTVTITNTGDTNPNDDVTAGTVSANYLTKWSGTGNQITTSQIYDNGTNVGIGTASPSYKLDVSGSVRASSFLTTNGAMEVLRRKGGTADFLVCSQDGTGRVQFYWNVQSCGTSSTYQTSNEPAAKILWHPFSGTGFVLYYAPSGTAGSSISWQERFRVDLANNTVYIPGSLGIGTASPGSKLDVVGTARASSFVDRDNTAYYVDPSSTTTSVNVAGNVNLETNKMICLDGGTCNAYIKYDGTKIVIRVQ